MTSLNAQSPFFTVVIPTRNRPELFELALQSVLSQTFQDFEVVIVNDGSDPEFLDSYKKLEAKYTEKTHFVYQIKRPNGHGQSYSMNTGAYVGSGQYVCFLDDDDFWIDNEHLQNAFASIASHKAQVDAYYTNQEAFFSDGRKQTDNVWIEDLRTKVQGLSCDTNGAYSVDATFLMGSSGFAHLNCSIVRRQLYLEIKGMDENIRYECDRDIYLRTIDAAKVILYQPNVVSKHHIPDPKKSDNMSTLVSSFEKYLYQITVLEKAILLAQKECIRQGSKDYLNWIFRRICEGLLAQGRVKDASIYAFKALSVHYSFKWHLYALLIKTKALVSS